MRLPGSAVLTLLLSACSSSPASPSNYAVAYELTASGGATFDSVKYDNGHGSLIAVVAPSVGWLVSVSVPSGGSVEAHAWGSGGGGQTVKLKATWTLSGVSTDADSSVATLSASGSFTLDVARR